MNVNRMNKKERKKEGSMAVETEISGTLSYCDNGPM